jgi:hypothetical protein
MGERETRSNPWVLGGGAIVIAGILLCAGLWVWASFANNSTPKPNDTEIAKPMKQAPSRESQAQASALAVAESSRSASDEAIELAGPLEIFGIVVSPSGSRAPNVTISVWPANITFEPATQEGAPLAKTVSGSDGSFSLPSLPRRPLVVLGRAADGATAFAAIETPWLRGYRRLGALILGLETGVTIEGRIVGLPPGAAGKKVVIGFEMVRRSATGENVWFDCAERAGLAVAADASGRFALANVPAPAAGSLTLTARGDGIAGFAEVGVDPWPPLSTEIHVRAERALRGAVHGPGGEPIANAKIGFSRNATQAGADGTFTLRLDPRDANGTAEILVSAPGFAWRVFREDLSRADDAMPRIFSLDRGESVRGVVQSTNGSPAAGAWVTIEGKQYLPGQFNDPRPDRMYTAARLHEWESRRVRSDSQGNFSFTSLPPEPLLLNAEWPGLPGVETPHLSRPPEDHVVLVLANPPLGFGSVEGRVVERGSRQPVANFRAMVVTDWGVLRALPTGDGNFRLERCPAGTWRMRIVPGPGAQFSPVERWIGLDVNETIRDLFVEVSGRGRIALTLQDLPEKASDLVFALFPIEGDGLGDAPLDEAKPEGNVVTFDGVPAGIYAIHAVRGNCGILERARIRVEAGQTASEKITLVAGRPLFIVVTARDGEATIAPYGIRVRDATNGSLVFDRRPGSQRSLSGGGASAVLVPGKYVVSIDRRDRTLDEKQITIPQDDGAFAIFDIRADGQ